MGLDSYLTGVKTYSTDPTRNHRERENGHLVSEVQLQMGYWRKDWELHGYLSGLLESQDNNCEKLYMSEKQVEEAYKHFCGWTKRFECNSDAAESFANAKRFLDDTKPPVYRSIYYLGSF